MSIISRVKRTFKSAASKVVNVAKNSFAAVVKPFTQAAGKSSLPKSQPDYTGLNFVEKKTLTAGNRPQDILSSGLKSGALKVISPGSSGGLLNVRGGSKGSSVSSKSLSSPGLSNSYGGAAPVPKTLSAGQRSSNSVGSSSFSSKGLTTKVSGESSSPFGSLSSESLSSSPTISLPSAPSYANVSSVTNAGLAGAASEGQTYDPVSGLFLPAEADANAVSEEERRKKDFEELLDMTPQKESVYEDREVKRQQKEVRERQQELNNYTAQLNNVVAKRDADLLKVRGIGSEEGVTEAVYGGQAATIEREAAIRALPIQAQVAAAQGNLELAQDYLSELITVKRDIIDADYEYNKAKFDAISGFLSKEEKIRLDKMTKDEDRAYDRAQKNLDLQDEWAKTAIENGQNHLVSRIHALNAGDPDFQAKLGQIIAGIQDLDALKKMRDNSGSGASVGAIVDRNGNPLELTAGQAESIANFNSTVSSAQQALSLLDAGVTTGPVTGRLLQARKAGDVADPKQLQLEQTLGKMKADFMKAISGAAVSDKEVARLSQFLPSITDQEGVIRSKLTTLIGETDRAKNSLLSTLGGSEVRLSSEENDDDPLGLGIDTNPLGL